MVSAEKKNTLRPPCLCIGQVSGRKIARKIASFVANFFSLFNGVYMYEREVFHEHLTRLQGVVPRKLFANCDLRCMNGFL